jgi:hypothetical protein
MQNPRSKARGGWSQGSYTVQRMDLSPHHSRIRTLDLRIHKEKVRFDGFGNPGNRSQNFQEKGHKMQRRDQMPLRNGDGEYMQVQTYEKYSNIDCDRVLDQYYSSHTGPRQLGGTSRTLLFHNLGIPGWFWRRRERHSLALSSE